MKTIKNTKELDKIITENPMSLESVKYIIKNKIDKITSTWCVKQSTLIPSKENLGKYGIYVSTNEEPEAQKISLLHKIAHIYYDVSAVDSEQISSLRSIVIEGFMDRAANEFYLKHKRYVDKYYPKVVSALEKMKIGKKN